MFAVTEETTKTEIIGFIENIQELVTHVDKQITKMKLEYTKLQNISSSKIHDDTYLAGYYLVEDQNTFTFYKKDVQVNVGYVYNTTTCTVVKICSWYCISVPDYVVYPNRQVNTKQTDVGDPITTEYFDLNGMCLNPKILMLSKRGCGKTYVIRSVIKYLQSLPNHSKDNLVVAPTDMLSPFYKYFVNNSIIKYHVYNSLKDIQRITKRHSNGYLIMDDCFRFSEQNNDKTNILEMLLSSTNKNASIVTVQAPILISESVAKDFDYIFLFNENSETNRVKLHTNYCNFMSLDDFEQIMDNLANYQVMVIDNTSSSFRIKDRVKLFTAEKCPCD